MGKLLFQPAILIQIQLKLKYADNGIGIPEDDIPHIFEPFFSTKQDTSGIGLGSGNCSWNYKKP